MTPLNSRLLVTALTLVFASSCATPNRALAAVVVPAPAAGPSTGGGGDVAIYAGDDRVVLADPFVRKGAPGEVPAVPSKELVAEINRAVAIAGAYYANMPILSKITIGPRLHFYYVDAIPDFPECAKRMTYRPLPSGVSIAQVACTIDYRTWILKSLFDKMSLRDQALLLVHEGLRRLHTNLSDLTIANITTGLGIVLTRLNAQLMGDRTLLPPDEVDAVQEFVDELVFSLRDTPLNRSLSDRAPYTVLPSGGIAFRGNDAVDPMEHVDPTAFIGIGSQISQAQYVGKNSVLVWTNICAKYLPSEDNLSGCRIAENVTVQNSDFSGSINELNVGSNSTVENSTIYALNTFSIGNNSRITQSRIHAPKVILGSGVTLNNFRLNTGNKSFRWSLEIADRVTFDDVAIENLDNTIEVRTGVTLAHIHAGRVGNGWQNWGGSFAGFFKPMRMVFMPGTAIDLQNRTVCANGRNDFIPGGGRYYEIKNEKDLVDSCAE